MLKSQIRDAPIRWCADEPGLRAHMPQGVAKKIKKQIEEKTKYLNKLIEEQNFEEAAVVRDEIKALKDESEVSRNE